MTKLTLEKHIRIAAKLDTDTFLENPSDLFQFLMHTYNKLSTSEKLEIKDYVDSFDFSETELVDLLKEHEYD